MDDLVLKGYINSFAEVRGISNLPFDGIFEVFAASTILRRYHQTDVTGMEEWLVPKKVSIFSSKATDD